MKQDLNKNSDNKEKRLEDWVQASADKKSLPTKPTKKNTDKKSEEKNESQNITLKQQDKVGWFLTKKITGIVVDVILYPLIMLSILTSMISITARDNGQVRNLFGYSIVTILSGSMRAGGFDVGDVVFLKSQNPEDVKPSIVFNRGQEDQEVVQLGDVIAFYRYSTGAPSETSSYITKLTPGEELPTIDENAEQFFSPNIRQEAINKKVEVVFHRVVDIFLGVDGTYFFKTRGDSNGIVRKEVDGVIEEKEDWTRGYDTFLVSEHLVVGTYTEVSNAITSALTYMITPEGMFWVIIVPLAVIVFLQIIELMTIIFDMATEKKVLEGTLEFDSEESIKAKVGREMSEYNKIYFYDISPPEDKNRVREFLWEEGFEKNPRKEAEIQSKVDSSVKLYNESRESYWKFWIENAKSKGLKSKLTKLQRNANIIVKTKMLQTKKD